MHHQFHWVFADSEVSVGYVSKVIYTQKLLATETSKSHMAQPGLQPRASVMHLYFHAIMFLRKCTLTILSSTSCNSNCGMRLGYAIQPVVRAWNAYKSTAGLGRTQIALRHDMFYNICTVVCKVVDSGEEWWALQRQQICYGGSDLLVMPREAGYGSVVM